MSSGFLPVLLVVVGMSLGGCVDGGPPGPGETPEPALNSETLHLRFANMLVLNDSRPGDTVSVVVDREDAERECGKLPGFVEGERSPFFWFNVWNRTGLAQYWHVQVPYPIEGDLRYEIELPSDPPFLLWPGFECTATARLEFRASSWTKTPVSVVDDGDPIDKERIVDVVYRWANVTVPVGQMEGSSILPLYGNDFFMMVRASVEPVQGNRYGDFYAYEPHQRPPDGDWYQHEGLSPLGRDNSATHNGVGLNGEYLYLVRLQTPAATETLWVAKPTVLTFRPNVADYGFQYPFDLYDDNPER